MTDFIGQPNIDGLVKLSGKMTDYRKDRGAASFVFTESDRTRMGVVAIAAALAGQGGQATAMAANASSMEEIAEYVQFSLDGQPVKGWLWRSPFKEGDAVEVAAEWQGDHYEAFGVARPADRIVALYPHCSRGKTRHVKTVLKWWFFLGFFGTFAGMFFLLFLLQGFSAFAEPIFYAGCCILSAIFAIMFFSLGQKWMPYVRVAEKVFTALGWPHPGNVDLVRSSKAQRKKTDPGEFGTFYFRY
jgi:hypothetical protein